VRVLLVHKDAEAGELPCRYHPEPNRINTMTKQNQPFIVRRYPWLMPTMAMFLGVVSANAQSVSLTDLPILPNRESGKVAPDKDKDPILFVNKTQKGEPLSIGEKTYAKGLISYHGSLSWSYALNGEYSSLVMDLGGEGMAAVRLLGDDKLLYDSGTLPRKSHLMPLIDLRGVKELQIAVVDNDGGFWNDKVVFGNPILWKATLPDAKDSPGKAGTAAPIAKIVVSPAEGPAPLDVTFTGDQSKAPAGQVGRYTWNFGDGNTETLSPNPTHSYAGPGLYEVVLQAEDDKGGVGVARALVTVRPSENLPPIAKFSTSARLVNVGEAVKFDASDSSSDDGPIASYQWDFGDGSKGEGKTVSHSYNSVGRYSAVLSVANKGAKQAKSSASIKVTGQGHAPMFPLHKGARVLLIGNSLIGFSGPIDSWLESFDKLSPHPLGLVCQSRGKGLGKLVEYATWSRLAIHDKIEEGWDVVIIQPWLDAVDPNVSDEQLLKDCKTLVDWAREVGAEPVLYEPQFGWQELEHDTALGHKRIYAMAEKLDTGFIPGGDQWLQVAKDFPMKKPGHGRSFKETDPDTLDGMMYGDFGHQNFTGALFNSMMIWKYLTGESPTELNLSATAKGINDQARKAVAWEKLPYLEKLVDSSITPASQKLR
jgi:PKD repeat protein